MIDLQVGFVNGTGLFVTVQTFGVSFEGGCAASRDLVDVSEMEERGIRLTRVCVPLEEQRGETPYLEDYPLVRADEVGDVVFVKNGVEFLMFRDRYGTLLDPTMAALFAQQEAIAHIAAYLAERVGPQGLPQSVVDKLLPPDDLDDADAETRAEALAAAWTPPERSDTTPEGDAPAEPDGELDAAAGGMMDELADVLGL